MKETFTDTMLSLIMRYGAVTRESLFLIKDDRRYTERVIKKCIFDGYIEEHVRKDEVKVNYLAPVPTSKLKRVVDGKRIKKSKPPKEEHHYFRTLKYYTLTDSGMDHLISTGRVEETDAPTAELLRKQFSRGGHTMDRLLGVSQSEMLLWLAPYIDADVYAHNAYRLELLDGIGFANAKTVKHIAQNGGNTVDAVSISHDYDRGRYNGCYFSSKAAVAVYNNFSPGFTWSKQAASPEKTAIDLFVNTLKLENSIKEDMEVSACVLFTNPTHLKQIFHDLPGARRIPSESNSRGYMLGDPFQAMYAIPINLTGAFHLRDILERKCEELRLTVLRYYWDNGYKSDISLPGQAMIRNPSDSMQVGYVVSVNMDLKCMLLLQEHIKANPTKKFGVICSGWQIPYWKAVFGDGLPIIVAPQIDE